MATAPLCQLTLQLSVARCALQSAATPGRSVPPTRLSTPSTHKPSEQLHSLQGTLLKKLLSPFLPPPAASPTAPEGPTPGQPPAAQGTRCAPEEGVEPGREGQGPQAAGEEPSVRGAGGTGELVQRGNEHRQAAEHQGEAQGQEQGRWGEESSIGCPAMELDAACGSQAEEQAGGQQQLGCKLPPAGAGAACDRGEDAGAAPKHRPEQQPGDMGRAKRGGGRSSAEAQQGRGQVQCLAGLGACPLPLDSRLAASYQPRADQVRSRSEQRSRSRKTNRLVPAHACMQFSTARICRYSGVSPFQRAPTHWRGLKEAGPGRKSGYDEGGACSAVLRVLLVPAQLHAQLPFGNGHVRLPASFDDLQTASSHVWHFCSISVTPGCSLPASRLAGRALCS